MICWRWPIADGVRYGGGDGIRLIKKRPRERRYHRGRRRAAGEETPALIG
jgi:hypothetical protein